MKTVNLADILAYYLNKLSSAESKRVEAAIEAEPDLISLFLGLKRLDEELSDGECLDGFLEESKSVVRSRLFK